MKNTSSKTNYPSQEPTKSDKRLIEIATDKIKIALDDLSTSVESIEESFKPVLEPAEIVPEGDEKSSSNSAFDALVESTTMRIFKLSNQIKETCKRSRV
jgi:hypothetical protein